MIRIIKALCMSLAIGCATAAFSKKSVFDDDALFAAIQAKDYDRVENALDKAQNEFLRGEATAEYMRDLFGIFVTNNPEIAEFTEGWMERYPDSPYALTAMAWVYDITGSRVRGGKSARETHPEALRQYSLLQEEAWQLADKAYQIDDRLLPASDALLFLANSTGRKKPAYKILHNVMSRQPNMRTLEVALSMTTPGWGGDWNAAEKICDRYGAKVRGTFDDPTLSCKVYAAFQYHRNEKDVWLEGIFSQEDLPEMDYARIMYVTHHLATRSDAAFAYEYLSRDDITDYQNARRFDENVAMKYGYEFLSDVHQRREKENAEAKIERDPYNPRLLKILADDIMRFERNGQSYSIRTHERVPREDQIEYARRTLLAAPFDPRNWDDYGSKKHPGTTPEDFLKGEPFEVNEVYYSNHNPQKVQSYAFKKWNKLNMLQRLESDAERIETMDLSEEERKELNEQMSQWLAYRESINLDKELRCPMMRAYRLHQYICETGIGHDCEIDQQMQEMYEIVRADVNERRVCTGVMNARAHELFFEAVLVDLSVPEG